MSDAVITVESLSKCYRLGQLGTDPVAQLVRWVRRQPPAPRNFLWALKDASFAVRQGEALGIVGPNGAGKSTLLKILSRISDPTSGRVLMRGRVASLLEVGTGFHPELTGRENIYLNGSILGMRRHEIQRQFDAIVDFAGIERFLDTPVKRYSSGMFVRLAFSVAAHLEPEILIIDEVLAVGDAAFQHKCLGRMQSLASGGRTVLFVSHNLAAINYFCGRAIRLGDGRLVDEGDPLAVTGRYSAEQSCGTRHGEFPPEPSRPLHVRALTVNGVPNGPGGVMHRSRPIEVLVDYEVTESVTGIELGLTVEQPDGLVVLNTRDTDAGDVHLARRMPGRYVARVELPGDLLNAGMYFVRGFVETAFQGAPAQTPALTFELVDDAGVIAARSHGRSRAGVMFVELPWATGPQVAAGVSRAGGTGVSPVPATGETPVPPTVPPARTKVRGLVNTPAASP
jgi:lipopolysaccharide transport system ATP-binding protein